MCVPRWWGLPWRGCAAYGLKGSCRFCLTNPKRRRLLRAPVWPSEPGYKGAKISGDPVQSVCSQGVLTVSLLRAFSGVDTRAPGIKSNWCIYGIHAVYGCLAVWEPHQWWWTLATVPPGDHFLSPIPDGRGSYERGWRSTLFCRLELFFQLKCNIILSTCPG